MTCKELMLYILANDLENELVFDHGRFIGFMTIDEVALQMNIGIAAVCALIEQEMLDHICVGNALFVPANFKVERTQTHE